MNNPKKQLRAFYKAKGLTGKRLKRSVWADYNRIAANADWGRDKLKAHPIDGLFSFYQSPEGAEYWGRRVYLHMYRGRK